MRGSGEQEWTETVTNRVLSLLLNEIAITNRKVESYRNLNRVLLTILAAAILALFTTDGMIQFVILLFVLFVFFKMIDIWFWTRRAIRLEDAFRGLLLRPEFDLPLSKVEGDPGLLEYIAILIGKRQELSTLKGATDAVAKNEDIDWIIEKYGVLERIPSEESGDRAEENP